MVEKIFTTSNVLLHICDFRVHMQNKYLRLQIYCDFSVRIQNLQLQVLETFATIIPSYIWTVRCSNPRSQHRRPVTEFTDKVLEKTNWSTMHPRWLTGVTSPHRTGKHTVWSSSSHISIIISFDLWSNWQLDSLLNGPLSVHTKRIFTPYCLITTNYY